MCSQLQDFLEHPDWSGNRGASDSWLVLDGRSIVGDGLDRNRYILSHEGLVMIRNVVLQGLLNGALTAYLDGTGIATVRRLCPKTVPR